MAKKYIKTMSIFVLVTLLTTFVPPVSFSQTNEQLTLTTYYPAPYGVYKKLKTTENTMLATDVGFVQIIGTTNPIVITPNATGLYVAGDVEFPLDPASGVAYRRIKNVMPGPVGTTDPKLMYDYDVPNMKVIKGLISEIENLWSTLNEAQKKIQKNIEDIIKIFALISAIQNILDHLPI